MTTCWVWEAAKTKGGYGMVRWEGQSHLVHRLTYEATYGPIPKGFDIDHLCRNRGCYRPDHLEAVTRRENLRRGIGITATNMRKTHCPRGHLYDIIENGNSRGCRTCKYERWKRWNRKRLASEVES